MCAPSKRKELDAVSLENVTEIQRPAPPPNILSDDIDLPQLALRSLPKATKVLSTVTVSYC